jgi:hypothetical protein
MGLVPPEGTRVEVKAWGREGAKEEVVGSGWDRGETACAPAAAKLRATSREFHAIRLNALLAVPQ